GLPKSQPAVMLGWMNNWQYAGKVPTSPWRGQMTVPRKLALRHTSGGLRLIQEPSDALARLRGKRIVVPSDDRIEAGTTYELRATIAMGDAQEAGWKLREDGTRFTVVGYDRQAQRLFVDRTRSGDSTFSKDFPVRVSSPLAVEKGTLQLTVLVDQ